MTSDKEMLELAAKAVGMDLTQWEWTSDPFFEGFMLQDDEPDSAPQFWNPLTDDGDALRLAVKLHMTIDRSETQPAAFVYCDWRDECDIQAVEPYDNNPYTATRRAIVRAAAEIGKEKK